MSDERWQEELEQERMMRSLEVLQRVARGLSNEQDALFLAAELGLVLQYKQETEHA